MKIFLSAMLLIASHTGCVHGQPADLVLRNGKILTVDEKNPQVQALAARGDLIVALGSDQAIGAYIGEATRVIDLQGRLAIPGFIEGHGHFMGLGQSMMRLQLARARSWPAIVDQVEKKVKTVRPGDWIIGRGWHQEKWDHPPSPHIEGLPLHHDLSQVSPDNPVLLIHASGHSAIANAMAMKLAGITRHSSNPAGGEILRDRQGEPIGVLRETAMDPLQSAWATSLAKRSPTQAEADRKQAIALATAECLAKGVTSFQDAGSPFALIDFYRKLAEAGKLGVRLWVMISADNQALAKNLAQYRIIDHAQKHLTVKAIKRLADGALGSHGAWLLEPYADLPASSGLSTTPAPEMAETARLALKHGFQLCTHAIGDRANREVLNIYQQIFQKNPSKQDLRWRIEHAQHLHPDDIPRFAKLGVIASMQGIHCTADGPWVIKRLGERRAQQGAYAWRSLLNTGAILANGTDTPVEDVNPIPGFHALVTRQMNNGQSFFPDQRLTRQEALQAYTLNAAYAAFEEHSKGSLAPGKLADIVILSRDIMTIPTKEISGTQVLYTILGGKVVFEK